MLRDVVFPEATRITKWRISLPSVGLIVSQHAYTLKRPQPRRKTFAVTTY